VLVAVFLQPLQHVAFGLVPPVCSGARHSFESASIDIAAGS
jgi:hypothetical protein